MTELIRASAALLAVLGTAGFLALRDRVCHGLRLAWAAGIVLLTGVFYGSGLAASGGALGVVLGGVAALVRAGLPRLRSQSSSGVRHETGH